MLRCGLQDINNLEEVNRKFVRNGEKVTEMLRNISPPNYQRRRDISTQMKNRLSAIEMQFYRRLLAITLTKNMSNGKVLKNMKTKKDIYTLTSGRCIKRAWKLID